MKAELPDSPVLQQLETCALRYRCFTAQNIFYERDEERCAATAAAIAELLR